MKITGVIAEYNPFHNGHLFQLNKIREEFNSDGIVVILSSAFTQRGIPAIVDQHLRAKMALMCGADLVLELPIVYSTGSAEYFAKGSISMLDKLGVVTNLCFGSESGDIDILKDIAHKLDNETPEIAKKIKDYQSNGLTYPKARGLALELDESVITNPNNILGIEYIKALNQRKSPIHPVTITRNGNYLDEKLSTDGISSAMAIRNVLYNNGPLQSIENHVPHNVYELMLQKEQFLPIFMDDFSDFLLYQLIINEKKGFEDFYDVGSSLSNTINNNIPKFTNFSEFITLCKSKNYTYTRTNRALTHILLNISKESVDKFCDMDYINYARLLGFTQKGTEILNMIKKNSSIPIISKVSNVEKTLSYDALEAFNMDLFACHIYQSIKSKKYGVPYTSELSAPIIIEKK